MVDDPPPPPQPRVHLPVEDRMGDGGFEEVEAEHDEQQEALTSDRGTVGAFAARDSDDPARISSEAAAAADAGDILGSSEIPPPPKVPPSSENLRTSNADLLLLRRCQRDASLLMARRYRATAGRAAIVAVEESAAPQEDPNLQAQREPDDADEFYDGAEAKEASRHHQILYIDTERPPAFRTDERAVNSHHSGPLEEQYHYVVTANCAAAGGGGDMSILSSIKDSDVDETRGLDEPSLATTASGPWSQHRARLWRGGCGSDIDELVDDREHDRSAGSFDREGAQDRSGIEMNARTREGRSHDTNPNHCEDEDADDEEDDEDDGCTLSGAPDSDYPVYQVKVNPEQMDRAVDIPLYSAARPHMRAFHISWVAFFVAFFVWFSISPLLGEIASTLNLTHEQIWTSSCLAVASSAITRIVVGPLNDMFGARYVMAATLVVAAVPTMLAGALVNTPTSLYLVRFFIGIAGSAFVTCQYWTSCMFTAEIAGTANALAAGWGNLGGGVAQIVVGSLLFPLFKLMYGGSGYSYHGEGEANSFETSGEYSPEESDNSTTAGTSSNDDATEARASELAWRTVLVVPAVLALVMAWVVVRYSDDTPKGCIHKRRRELPPPPPSRPSWSENLWLGMRSRNTWVLFVQYACCFGCELTLFNAAALYFKEMFGQSTETAAAIASVFGWTNLFARGIGGFCSDMANAKCGMRGRLWVQSCFLVAQGVLIMAFSEAHTLAGSIFTMLLFSIFLQAAEGSTFAIVPYVVPERMGSVAGLVGAGGNVGGVCFTLLFRSFDYQSSFLYMGAAVSVSALFTVLISLKGHRGLFHGQDSPIVYEHRRMAKLPQAVAFVRPENARNPRSDPAAESTPEGGGAGSGGDEHDHDSSASSPSAPANP